MGRRRVENSAKTGDRRPPEAEVLEVEHGCAVHHRRLVEQAGAVALCDSTQRGQSVGNRPLVRCDDVHAAAQRSSDVIEGGLARERLERCQLDEHVGPHAVDHLSHAPGRFSAAEALERRRATHPLQGPGERDAARIDGDAVARSRDPGHARLGAGVAKRSQVGAAQPFRKAASHAAEADESDPQRALARPASPDPH